MLHKDKNKINISLATVNSIQFHSGVGFRPLHQFSLSEIKKIDVEVFEDFSTSISSPILQGNDCLT